MKHLLDFAWANRETILRLARKLKPRWSWLWLALAAAIVFAVITYGYRIDPRIWSPAQWAQLVVNLAGLAVLFVAQHIWWNRQDQVWDEVDEMRKELDELREAVHMAKTEPLDVLVPPLESYTVQRNLGGRTFNFKEES